MVANTGQEIKEGEVFLCHKCNGLLFPQVGNKLVGYPNTDVTIMFRCRCMSGYVRSGYTAISLISAIETQRVQRVSNEKWDKERKLRNDLSSWFRSLGVNAFDAHDFAQKIEL